MRQKKQKSSLHSLISSIRGKVVFQSCCKTVSFSKDLKDALVIRLLGEMYQGGLIFSS